MSTTLYNFDSGYSAGALNGQNGWTADLSADFDVSTIQKYSGTQSVRRKVGGTWSSAQHSMPSAPTGSLSFRWRTVGTHSNPFRGLQFAVRTGTTSLFNIGTKNTNTFRIEGATGADLGSFSTNTWYLVECEWDYATQKIRGRFNGGSWSSWLNPSASWTAVDGIVFLSLSQEFFIDDITYIVPENATKAGILLALI